MDQGAANPAKCVAGSLPMGDPSFSRFIENAAPPGCAALPSATT